MEDVVTGPTFQSVDPWSIVVRKKTKLTEFRFQWDIQNFSISFEKIFDITSSDTIRNSAEIHRISVFTHHDLKKVQNSKLVKLTPNNGFKNHKTLSKLNFSLFEKWCLGLVASGFIQKRTPGAKSLSETNPRSSEKNSVNQPGPKLQPGQEICCRNHFLLNSQNKSKD